MSRKQNPYMSGTAMGAAAVKKYVLTILGMLLTAFFAIGLALAVTDRSLRGNWIIYAVFLLLSLLMLWNGLRVGRHAELARRYQGIFAADQNGLISLEELAAQTGKTGQQITRELETLFRRGFFKNCSLQRSPFAVRLSGVGKKEAVFLTVTCPHCGAGNRIRAGEQGFCEYCGGAVGDRESTAKSRYAGGEK